MDKNVEQKLTKAKIQLIINHPFFASLALGVEYKEDPMAGTAYTDGRCIAYDPAYFKDMDIQNVMTVLVHEVSHLALHHHLRMGNRDTLKWNIACDYAVNDLLKKSGFYIPNTWMWSRDYEGMSAEEIYAILPDSAKEQFGGGSNGGNGDGQPWGPGGVKHAPVNSKSELSQAEAEMNAKLVQAVMAAKQADKLPAHLGHLVDKLLQPTIDWKSELSAFLTAVAADDYSWSRPSRRALARELYLPSLRSQGKGDFVLMIDTSGSTFSPVILRRLASEVQSIVSDVGGRVRILHVDATLQFVEELDGDDEIDLNLRGGGGTDFRPGFEWLARNGEDVSAVVYFTDGECDSFPEDPGVPTLWAIYDNQRFDPPFGEVIHIPLHKIQEEEYAKY